MVASKLLPKKMILIELRLHLHECGLIYHSRAVAHRRVRVISVATVYPILMRASRQATNSSWQTFSNDMEASMSDTNDKCTPFGEQ
jgi:hypothetical protein